MSSQLSMLHQSLGSPSWLENSPDSLWTIALEFCALNPDKIFDKSRDGYYLRPGDYCLPRVISDALLKTTVEVGALRRRFLHLFRDTRRTELKRIDIRCLIGLEDIDVSRLLCHRPIELGVSADSLTADFIRSLNKYSSNLRSLYIADSKAVMTDVCREIHHAELRPTSRILLELCETNFPGSPHIINCPALRSLSLIAAKRVNMDPMYLTFIIDHILFGLPGLVRLDLTDCEISVGLMKSLTGLRHIQDLNLTNVDLEPLSSTLPVISMIHSLRCLDLSQSLAEDQTKLYTGDIDSVMRDLLKGLPNLAHLDIAGTNLAGRLPHVTVSYRPSGCKQGSIVEPAPPAPPAIPWMDERTLDYLGLLNCVDGACDRENIPARQVTGDATEAQILLSLISYSQKRELLLIALNNLFHHFKFSQCTDHQRSLQGIMLAMKTHSLDKAIQISGSASLFYIVKGEFRHQFTTRIKKDLIQIILNGMDSFQDEPTMLRNGCLTLCHFTLPQDVIHCYSRLVVLLLRIAVCTHENENFVQRISIFLLNSLACQVDTKEKLLIGQHGAFKTMLNIISQRVENGVCDEVMEVAWSMMWNVTDETAYNSERFIEEKGMDVFLSCLEKFPNNEELLRNMMGLIGNVAEVDYLRPKLLQSRYVQIFSDLLSSASDGIEVSYNACGVLANLMSDGPTVWTIATPRRADVLHNMHVAISRWKLNTRRNINYRSFKPILRLLPISETPQVQHWAAWALCNLTKMYKSKYCPLLERENGVVILTGLLSDTSVHRSYPDIKPLVLQILNRCTHFNSDPEYISANEDEPN